MSVDHYLLEAAKHLVEALDHKVDEHLPEELAEIIKFQSKGAAASAVASGWIPGAGSTIAVTISAGFIWTMYARINSAIGLSLSDNILKTLASGVVTNLMAAYAGGWLLTTAMSFIPGMGSIGAAVLCYALTLASGYIYLKIMTEILSEEGKEGFQNLTEADLKRKADKVAKSSDVENIMKEAKKSYKS